MGAFWAGANRASKALLTALLLLAAPVSAGRADDGAFRRWVEELWPDAQKLGISRATFDAAFSGVGPDLSLPDLILPGRTRPAGKDQPEFSKTPVQYLHPPQLTRLAAQGRAFLDQHRELLERIERETGVDRYIVLAIWGRETAYGHHRLPHNAIVALVTQAYLGRRKEMFREELLYALKMLEDGVISKAAMRSSWAGAMGLTQFMPSEFYTTAVDMDGDGKKDIWTSLADALGSAAMQLKQKGWVEGQPWGHEVRLPPAGSCLWEGIPQAKPLHEWQRLGIARADGSPFAERLLQDQAFLVLPASHKGPAFLVFENYLVIKRYNMSDLYVLFVGHLADRIAGRGAFRTPWGAVRQLSNVDIEEIQERLKARGFDVEKVDGRAGMNTRNQIGAYQKASRMPVDCWPSDTVLSSLRRTATR